MLNLSSSTNTFRRKKIALLLNVFLISIASIFSQNQPLADSLELLYNNNLNKEEAQLDLLLQLASHQTLVEKKLKFSQLLIDAATTPATVSYLIKGHLEKGNAYRLKSDFSKALDSYFIGAKIGEANNQITGGIYIAIADVYSIMENNKNARNYYQKAIQLLRIETDSINLGSVLLNAGDDYFNSGQLDTALLFTTEASAIFKKIDYPLGQAYGLGNLGMIYAQMGQDRIAERNMNQAIQLMEKLNAYYPITVYLAYISDIYQTKGITDIALKYTTNSLELAQIHGLKQQVNDAHLKLSELYEQTKNYNQSLFHFKNHTTYRDSIQNIAEVQKIAELRTDFEVSQKQTEVDLLNQEKKTQQVITNSLGLILGLITLFSLLLYRNYKAVVKARKESDELLLNILPAETAAELKQNGKVVAKKINAVTVLFTDFKDFTKHTENLSPEILVARIDYYFSKFDAIIEKHGLEKIKTIGDAYMCVGGLPLPTNNHAHKTVAAALDIIEFIIQEKQEAPKNTLVFDIRIGINTGPVVAGVVGIKKFAYDIWGDTVNIAARMETNSQLGKINISESTYQLVKADYNCSYRGKIDVKNKGLMNMYFVKT